MSTSDDFTSDGERREWEAQERALREERLGAGPDPTDAQVIEYREYREYRLLMRALRTPPLDPIPGDFSARTAAHAQGGGVEDDRLEVWLQNALLVLLVAGGVWALAESGGRWLQTLAAPESAARPVASWGAAILACIALSSMLERWRRFLSSQSAVPHDRSPAR